MFFCFFKQKTAYEMRISDWSSDVCSSDLRVGIIIVMNALKHGGDPLQPHAGIYGRARQIDPGFLVHLLILHEDQVPDLYEPVAVLIRRTGRPAGDVLSVIEEYLGTGAARAGVAPRPAIIRCRYAERKSTRL